VKGANVGLDAQHHPINLKIVSDLTAARESIPGLRSGTSRGNGVRAGLSETGTAEVLIVKLRDAVRSRGGVEATPSAARIQTNVKAGPILCWGGRGCLDW
jgi:hypothetical protein